MFCREPHTRRDTPDEPMSNIMREGRLDAALTASQNHTHRAPRNVTKAVNQRSQTYQVHTEA